GSWSPALRRENPKPHQASGELEGQLSLALAGPPYLLDVLLPLLVDIDVKNTYASIEVDRGDAVATASIGVRSRSSKHRRLERHRETLMRVAAGEVRLAVSSRPPAPATPGAVPE